MSTRPVRAGPQRISIANFQRAGQQEHRGHEEYPTRIALEHGRDRTCDGRHDRRNDARVQFRAGGCEAELCDEEQTVRILPPAGQAAEEVEFPIRFERSHPSAAPTGRRVASDSAGLRSRRAVALGSIDDLVDRHAARASSCRSGRSRKIARGSVRRIYARGFACLNGRAITRNEGRHGT